MDLNINAENQQNLEVSFVFRYFSFGQFWP